MTSVSTFAYGCIIDAGSSGSRIYLYRWPKGDDEIMDGNNNRNSNIEEVAKGKLNKVEQQAIFSDERHVGISVDGGIDMLNELLTSAKSALHSLNSEPSDVPIHLGATAGMRLINSGDDDNSAVDTIMERVRSLLHASGFKFQNDWARTISGTEESVYGWLVANYLRNDGNFPKNNNGSNGESSFGALDLGGASTQISVELPNAMNDSGSSHYPLRIGHLQYPLYTQSYLYFGADQARIRYETNVLSLDSSSPSNSKVIVNPCYPTGYTNADTGITGSSNWDECFDNVAKLFHNTKSNLRGGGSEGDDALAIVPPPIANDSQQRFIAMSVFVFIWDFLGLQIGIETDDLRTLKKRASDICTLSHAEQTKQYDAQMKDKPSGRKTNKPFAQCFNAAYSYHLLSNGYGLAVEDTPIEIYYDINGGKVQWALGLMLVEANNNGIHSIVDAGKEQGNTMMMMDSRKTNNSDDMGNSATVFSYAIVMALVILAVMMIGGSSIRFRMIPRRRERLSF